MHLISIAERNLRQRKVTSTLTVLSILLGTALVAFLWLVAEQAERRYQSSSKGYQILVGPKGSSPLSLVLNTVFHLGISQGVVPFSVYEELHDGKWAKRRLGLRYAIPTAVGDSYRGYRLVGTTDELFHRFALGKVDGKPNLLRFADGKAFRFTHEDLLAEAKFQVVDRKRRAHLIEHAHAHEGEDPHAEQEVPAAWKEIVIGAEVARKLGLRVGDEIVPSHGAEGGLHEHDEGESKIVGILAPTGTPIDRALYAPLGLLYRLAGHNAIADENAEDAEKIDTGQVEVSAIIVDTRNKLGPILTRRRFQRRPEAQAVVTADEIRKLFAIVGDISLALRAISYLTLFVGALAIFIALYQTMFQRKRDVAIMRSLGARRSQIFGIVLLEAFLITALGAVLGVLVAHGAAYGLQDLLMDRAGIPLDGVHFAWADLWLILGVTVLGMGAGLLPALATSYSDVARQLAPDR